MENEQARMEACFALAWVATDATQIARHHVVKKIHDNTKTDPKANFLRHGVHLETVIHRPVPDATAGLVDLLTPSVPDIEVRHQIARAIGIGRHHAQHGAAHLRQALRTRPLKADAALALLARRRRRHGRARDRDCTTTSRSRPRRSRSSRTSTTRPSATGADRNYDGGDIARWVTDNSSGRRPREGARPASRTGRASSSGETWSTRSRSTTGRTRWTACSSAPGC